MLASTSRYPAIVLVLIGLAWPGLAASAFNCVANVAVPPVLRSESANAAAGDVTITCLAGTPIPDGQAIPAIDVKLVANTSVTSRVLASPWSEALLLLDEVGSSLPGDPSVQAPCQTADGVCTNLGNGQGRANGIDPDYYVGQGTGTNVNVFQGRVDGDTVVFPSIPLDPPGDSGMRVMRITNLRVDAHALAVGGATTATASLSLEGASPPPLANAMQIIGFVQSSADFSVRDAGSIGSLSTPVPISQCASITNVRVGTLRFSEKVGTTFKRFSETSSFTMPTRVGEQNVPGNIYNGETGFHSAALIGNPARGSLERAGLADAGTRLRVVFGNVPAGVSIYVDNTPSVGGDVARRTAAESGVFAAVGDTPGGPAGASAVSLVSGTGVAAWEITDTNAAAITNLDVGVYVSYAGVPPALGSVTVNGNLAPVGGDATGPIPRFVDTSTGFALLTITAGPECEALCGGSCEDGNVCTGYDACAPDGHCVHPAALSGFPRAACEIGRLEPRGLCGGDVFSTELQDLIRGRMEKALAMLGKAEVSSKVGRQTRLLRKTSGQLRRINRKIQHMRGLAESCRATIDTIVGAGTESLDALKPMRN